MANVERDLRALARLAPRPVRPDEAAAALGVAVGDVVDTGEALVAQGVLEFRDGGFAPGPQAAGEEISAVRDAQLAVSLAEALKAGGADPADVGTLYAAAGRWEDARDSLAAAALGPGVAQSRAFELAGLALEAQEHAPGLDRATQGHLRLVRARQFRATGRSADAMDELEFAVRWLEGLERVDALRLTTIVADDLQTSQRAETFAALGEREAYEADALAEVGSLHTLRGRVLSRIGFPREADRVLEVGLDLLNRHGDEEQKFTGRLNRAWVELDRGEARAAEAGFDRLRDEAMELEGPFSKADKEVYWARAAFAVGHPAGALEAVERAEAAGEQLNAPVIGFLAAIARAEGALYFERFEEALTAADHVLEFALSALPVWENRARVLRARALTGLGRLDEASDEAMLALEKTPEGVDGLRLRKEIEVIRLLALPEDASWPKKQVEDLTDELLQARWNLSALELMIERAKREKDDELALYAAGLAIELGIPTVAVRAADVADLWTDPAGMAVAFAAQGVVHQSPESWAAEWTALPHVAAALAVEVTDDETATETLTAQWAEVVSESGLAGYEVLSPAQRRAQGLVRRRAVTSWTRRILAGVGVAGVAAAAAILVVVLTDGGPPPTTVGATAPTTTTTLALEDRELVPPTGSLLGQAVFRADAGRSGIFAAQGPSTADGFYWRASTADQVVASPVTFGQWAFVASTDNTVRAFNMTDGSELWSERVGDAIRTTPAVGVIQAPGVGGQGGTQTIIAFGDDGGTVYFRQYDARSGGMIFSEATSGSIVGSPLIVGARVIVASSGPNTAEVISFLPISRETEWIFSTFDDEPIGAIRGAPAYHDGIVYVTTTGEQGRLYLVDAETGEGICRSQPLGDLFGPIVADGIVYVTAAQGQIYPLEPGRCNGTPENRTFVYGFAGGVTAEPVVVGDVLIVPTLSNMTAIDATNPDPNAYEWIVQTEATIVSAPVVAGDTVYFGNNAGVLYAVALDPPTNEGEVRWRWQTGNAIVSSVAVLDGVVLVTSTDTTLTAIGSGPTVVPTPPTTEAPTGDTTGDTGGEGTTTTVLDVTTTTLEGGTTTTRVPVVTTLVPPPGVGGVY